MSSVVQMYGTGVAKLLENDEFKDATSAVFYGRMNYNPETMSFKVGDGTVVWKNFQSILNRYLNDDDDGSITYNIKDVARYCDLAYGLYYAPTINGYTFNGQDDIVIIEPVTDEEIDAMF